MLDTDWMDPHSHITPNFTVAEACWLPTVNSWYYPMYQERVNLTRLCKTMEKIRALFNLPLVVHCMIRPDWYNTMVNGSKKSMHILGLACDFHVRGVKCDDARERLKPHLEALGICMEDNPGSVWVHIDLGEPRKIGGRFFQP